MVIPRINSASPDRDFDDYEYRDFEPLASQKRSKKTSKSCTNGQ